MALRLCGSPGIASIEGFLEVRSANGHTPDYSGETKYHCADAARLTGFVKVSNAHRIISDTHDQRHRTLSAVQLLSAQGAEVLIHCGDLIEPSMMTACCSLPCYFVFGNNDSYYANEIRAAIATIQHAVCLESGDEIKLAGKRIAVTHGHDPQIVRRLLAAGPDYMFSGHSHIAADWREGMTRRINPGALHRARQYSVALLNLETDELRFLDVPRS